MHLIDIFSAAINVNDEHDPQRIKFAKPVRMRFSADVVELLHKRGPGTGSRKRYFNSRKS